MTIPPPLSGEFRPRTRREYRQMWLLRRYAHARGLHAIGLRRPPCPPPEATLARCRSLVTALPGLPQVGAECGLYVAIRFKREAVCHLWRATPVLGHSASRITFFGNLDGYAAATLRNPPTCRNPGKVSLPGDRFARAASGGGRMRSIRRDSFQKRGRLSPMVRNPRARAERLKNHIFR